MNSYEQLRLTVEQGQLESSNTTSELLMAVPFSPKEIVDFMTFPIDKKTVITGTLDEKPGSDGKRYAILERKGDWEGLEYNPEKPRKIKVDLDILQKAAELGEQMVYELTYGDSKIWSDRETTQKYLRLANANMAIDDLIIYKQFPAPHSQDYREK